MRPAPRPGLELLEDRWAPATLTVNTLTDAAPDGTVATLSLREAILLVDSGGTAKDGNNNLLITNKSAQVNQTPAFGTNDTILFASALDGGTITLDGSILPALSGTLTITGPTGGITLDANHNSRILTISGGVTASLSGLTLSNGVAVHTGGGILNNGTLMLTSCTLSGNAVASSGGGIANKGSITLTDCTLSGNSGFLGGALVNIGGSATVADSTFSGNSVNSSSGSGAGIYNRNGTLSLTNSIVAGNTKSSGGANDINGTVTTDGGYNLIGDAASAGGLTDGNNHDIVGHAALLGPLGSYGGPVQTIPLLPGSPAIDAGNPSDTSADARGIAVVNGTRDIGAFESQGFTCRFSSGGPDTSTSFNGDWQTVNVNTALPIPLVALVSPLASGEPVAGGVLTFTPPSFGASVNLAATTATIAANGTASVTGTTNGVSGGYSVIASASGVTVPATFTLNNQPTGPVQLLTAFPLLTDNATAQPIAITAGPDGAMWFTEYTTVNGLHPSGLNRIGRINTAGVETTSYDIPTSSAGAASITSGPDGALWFTENLANKIGRVTTAGAFTEYNVPTANASPTSIIAGPDGALWFVEHGPNKIGRITTAGDFTEYTVPTANSGPNSIVVGPDSALWFAEGAGNKIGRITTAGDFTEYSVPTANAGVASIAAGSDGALWFVQNTHSVAGIGRMTTAGQYTQYPYPTSMDGVAYNAAPSLLTAGPDGALWFSIGAAKKIVTTIYGDDVGRITTSGEYQLHFLTPPRQNLKGLSVTAFAPGPDGGLWYTYQFASGPLLTTGAPGLIGRIDTTPTLVVDSLGDTSDGDYSPGHLTLREAIQRANLMSGHRTITFAPSLVGQTITLTSPLPALAYDVTITAPAGGITIDANHQSGILTIDSGVTVDLNGLTLANGSDQSGGGIDNLGTLTLTDCTLSGNSAKFGGGIDNVAASATLTLNDCTLSGNTGGSSGGGILNYGTLRLTNSTLSGNSSAGYGGAIDNVGTLTAVNSTIVLNAAASGGGGFYVFGGTVTLNNTLVAGNTSGGPNDITSFGTLSGSHNLIGDAGSAGGLQDKSVDAAHGNLVGINGSSTRAIATIISMTLAFNGGLTQTHALVASSPALDAGDTTLAVNASHTALTTDQRGDPFARVSGSSVDIGAFEAQPLTEPLVVNTSADTVDPSDGKLSLREAVLAANGLAGADTVTFDASLAGQTITLNGPLPAISDTLTVTGPVGGITIDANHQSGILTIDSGVTAALSGLTLTHGNTSGSGGGIFNAGTLTLTDCTLSDSSTSNTGGAIQNTGTLTLTDCSLSGNSAHFSGGGIYNDFGAMLTLTGCTLNDNRATTSGGGIVNFGTLTLTNCTVSGNSTSTFGGGIFTQTALTVINSTIVLNQASGGGGGIYNTVTGTVTLNNTIVAGNTLDGSTANDIVKSSSATVSGSHNLIGDAGNAGGLTNGTNGNLVGVNGSGTRAIATIINTTLANNGGPTKTHALASGSPAIDAGDSNLAKDANQQPLTTDQRGAPFARVFGSSVDIGACEAQNAFVVNTTVDSDNPGQGLVSLREAITAANANPGADTITFDPTVFGRPQTITLGGTALPGVSDALTITGPAGGLTIDGNHHSGILNIDSGVTASLSGLTLTNASVNLSGGGIFTRGTLTLTDCTLSDSSAHSGAGIYNTGSLTLTGCTLSGNSANGGSGAGIFNSGGTVALTDCTFSDNFATFNGGGILHSGGTLTLMDCTLSGNTGRSGGGIQNDGSLTLTDSTLSGNSASASGGGIASQDPLTLTNCTLAGNSAQNGGGIANGSTLTAVNSTIVLNQAPTGGGIANFFSTTTLNNTIVAGNTTNGTTPSDINNTSSTVSGSNNLIGDPNSAGGLTATNHNILGDGTGGVELIGSIIVGTTPANNGGPTPTFALATSSPALDHGSNGLAVDPSNNNATLTTDQRGFPFVRVFPTTNGTVDIGAYEAQTLSLVVNTTVDSLDPGAGKLSLREAIADADANPGADTITFDPSLSAGTITLSGTALPDISDDLTITGPTGGLTIDAAGNSGILSIDSGVTASLSGLTLTGGNTSEKGGAINNAGNLTLTNFILSDNTASSGGGIYTTSGSQLTLTGCTLSGNSGTDSAGGIGTFGGTMTLTGCTLSDNVGHDNCGGINDNQGTLTLTDCTISDNTASFGSGGGIIATGTVTLTGCTVSGNTAHETGGGIFSVGTLTLINSTVSNNSAANAGGILGNVLTVINCTIVFNQSPQGGGLDCGGITTLNNTIVAGNTTNGTSPSDISGTVTGSNNLIGDPASAGGLTNGQSGNIVGGNGPDNTEPISAIVVGTAPANNGGLTLTFALANGSPAINAGSNSLDKDASNNTLQFDQRGQGFPRMVGTVDIGAFESSTLFGDSFVGMNGAPLGASWSPAGGKFVIENGMAFSKGGPSTALAKGISVADVALVALDADVTLTRAGSPADLIAHYTGSGSHASYLIGRLIEEHGHIFAQILSVIHGVQQPLLGSARVTITGLSAHLHFEVFGSSLKLFVNGTLEVFANDNKLAGPGQVGMRAWSASLGNFKVTPLTATEVTLPFSDDFSQTTDGNQLSLAWMQQQGDFSIASGVLSGNAATSIATLNGLSVSSVSLEVNVTVNAKNGRAGFVSDYGSGANASYYLGSITQISSTQATLSIAKVVKGGKAKVLPGGSSIINLSPNTTQDLFFRVVKAGSSDDLILEDITNSQTVSVTDSQGALGAGTAGLEGTQDATFTSFQAATPHG